MRKIISPFERGTVYAIRHNPTGRIYVGSTRNLNARIRAHMTALLNGKHPVELMQQDFDRYGNDYSLFILHDSLREGKCTREYRKIESLFMTILGTRDPAKGYNYRDGKNFDLNSLQEYKVLYRAKDWMDPRYLRLNDGPCKYIRIEGEEEYDDEA